MNNDQPHPTLESSIAVHIYRHITGTVFYTVKLEVNLYICHLLNFSGAVFLSDMCIKQPNIN